MENTRKTKRDTWTRRLAATLFHQDDSAAVRHGWQVTAGPGGRGRIYRDCRFDRFACCPACGGAGTGCPGCTGTGRVDLTQDSRAGIERAC